MISAAVFYVGLQIALILCDKTLFFLHVITWYKQNYCYQTIMYSQRQARIQDFLTGGLTAGGSLPFSLPFPPFPSPSLLPPSPSLPPSLPLEVGPLKSS